MTIFYTIFIKFHHYLSFTGYLIFCKGVFEMLHYKILKQKKGGSLKTKQTKENLGPFHVNRKVIKVTYSKYINGLKDYTISKNNNKQILIRTVFVKIYLQKKLSIIQIRTGRKIPLLSLLFTPF